MKIDLVITYVDNNDPKWLEQFNQYDSKQNDKRSSYYNQTNLLKILF